MGLPPHALVSLQVDKDLLKPTARVSLDMTTLTIMRLLPREVDPVVHNMLYGDDGDEENQTSYANIGGLGDQLRGAWPLPRHACKPPCKPASSTL
jgi:ATP-dependent 26S proteasome regulatory subunit